MIQFMIGLITGGVIGFVLMAVCAVGGRVQECVRCQREREAEDEETQTEIRAAYASGYADGIGEGTE